MENLEMNLGSPFDFDLEDSLTVPNPASRKRKKVIGLDDLFNDHKEQEKRKKKKIKVVKARRVYASDNDDDDADVDETERNLTEVLNNFQRTIKEVDGKEVALDQSDKEDATISWGLQVFGAQRIPPLPGLGDSKLLQNFQNNEISELLDHSSEMGETFLEGLLLNGWLSKLVISCGNLEESIAKWTFNLLLYSSNETLMTSACDFWCGILSCRKVDVPVVKVKWLPGHSELKRALENFGFQEDSSTKVLPDVGLPTSNEQSNHNGFDCKGPPTNIRAWIKFANTCCQVRSRYPVFSTSEAEELIASVIYLFLERQLLGLTSALRECLMSAINFFEDKEWSRSCGEVATSLANRVPKDLNCLRIVECISGVDTRSSQLRSTIASQIIRSCFIEEMADAKDVLKFLLSINLKEKKCDLFKIYLYLVLTENWLLFGSKAKPTDNELWNNFIWKCSSQISNTDFRPCAQEIRSRASYLLQGAQTASEGSCLRL